MLNLEKQLISTEASLNRLFPEQKREDKQINRAKTLLGELAIEFTREELKDVIVQSQYLAESWLDDFERTIFEGKTLKELLHEKGPS